MLRGLLPVLQVFLDDLAEVVHGIKINIQQVGDGRVYITRYGDIDNKHRLVAALGEGCRDGLDRQQRHRARRGTDNDIGFRQVSGNLAQRNGIGVKAPGEFARSADAAIGDHHAAQIVAVQMPGGQFDSFSGADQQCGTLVKTGENLAGQRYRCVGDRYRAGADLGACTHLLGDRKGPPEKPAQQGPDGAGLFRMLKRVFELTEDLRFAKNRGIKPGGHRKNVLDHRILFQRIQTRAGFVGQLAVLDYPLRDLVRRALINRTVELGPVAGGDDQRFLDRRVPAKILQRRGQVCGRVSDLFTDRYRCATVIYSNDGERHARHCNESAR